MSHAIELPKTDNKQEFYRELSLQLGGLLSGERDAIGIDLWPASAGASEPLDCDEAAYAYIGHRILRGDVMYLDLTENKPPLGYWLYTLTVALGGYHELAIRVMPIP